MNPHHHDPRRASRAAALACLVAAGGVARADLAADLVGVWQLSRQRAETTAGWLMDQYPGDSGNRFVTTTDSNSGQWIVKTSGDWRAGFWPGVLWMLAGNSGDAGWLDRAKAWTAGMESQQWNSGDHDIGFRIGCSFLQGYLGSNDANDPDGSYRQYARQVILNAAATLDSRFNKPRDPDGSGPLPSMAIPASAIRSWDTIEGAYPVCIDNMMNLELLFAAWDLSGRPASGAARQWYEHAVAHATTTRLQHLRADGGTYHVVRHHDRVNTAAGIGVAQLGTVERKNTRQGYGDETTWTRGQAWAIYGFTVAYRHTRDDPSLLDPVAGHLFLEAARRAADHFIDRLPHHTTRDTYNARSGDFVPPTDFEAAIGEPAGPYCDAAGPPSNGSLTSVGGDGVFNQIGVTGTLESGAKQRSCIDDRLQPKRSYTLRDSSAASLAASALIELADYTTDAAAATRYLQTAHDILHCLIHYDGPDDSDTQPDYLNPQSIHRSILDRSSNWWGDAYRGQSNGDYYFLEALGRWQTREARKLAAATLAVEIDGNECGVTFQRPEPAAGVQCMVQFSPDLGAGSWSAVASKGGAWPWTGSFTVTETPLSASRVLVRVTGNRPPADQGRGFFRVLMR